MGWEKRGNKEYYYYKERINGRVVSRYVGNLFLVKAYENQVLENRRDQKIRKAIHLDMILNDVRIDDIQNDVEKITNTFLLINGYYKHKGEWRKKMKTKSRSNQGFLSRFRELEIATRKLSPKEEDISALRSELANHPEIVKQLGDLAIFIQSELISKSTDCVFLEEVLEAGVNLKRKELGYEESSELEKMLIESTLLAWLRLNIWEQRYSQKTAGELNIDEAYFWERRIDFAQTRFLRAVEKLTKVRKMIQNDPVLQINIANAGGQQVNLVNKME